MSDPETKADGDVRRLKNACAVLSEHFDTVQIFTTRHELDGTLACHWGSGDYYARKGLVQTWLLKENESSREEVRGDE